jgi:hypothetical protein
MSWLQAVTLRSPLVTLTPLDPCHREALMEAVGDGELFKLWYTAVPSPESMQLHIERRLSQQAAGAMLPFAIIDNSTAKAVGMTNYLNVDVVNGPWKSVVRGIAEARSVLASIRKPNSYTRARVCGLELYCGRVPNAFLQSSEPASDRAFRCEARRNPTLP